MKHYDHLSMDNSEVNIVLFLLRNLQQVYENDYTRMVEYYLLLEWPG